MNKPKFTGVDFSSGPDMSAIRLVNNWIINPPAQPKWKDWKIMYFLAKLFGSRVVGFDRQCFISSVAGSIPLFKETRIVGYFFLGKYYITEYKTDW